ncbi:hypothetical protein GCM10022247_62670 [Allokutzneria multivorans]|uniref:Uncharacterized protein n=1 Tax=Allokutzneria multivorans TaxID=1142134 RepID=A0ABP7TPM7_9PSEU
MGLDAFVLCRCWVEGRTTPPPVPRELIVVPDEHGPSLELDYDGNEELFSRFDSWRVDCCEHSDMEYASQRIGTWSGVRQFQWALGAVGGFPVLRSILPSGNGGTVEPDVAARALVELADFVSCQRIGERAELYDGDTGAVVARQNPAFGGFFSIGPGGRFGVDSGGLFVVEGEREVFRALRTRQRVDGDGAWLADLDRDERGETRIGATIGGGASTLLIRAKAYTAADFEFQVRALTTVFEAAVKIGNPVVWC